MATRRYTLGQLMAIQKLPQSHVTEDSIPPALVGCSALKVKPTRLVAKKKSIFRTLSSDSKPSVRTTATAEVRTELAPLFSQSERSALAELRKTLFKGRRLQIFEETAPLPTTPSRNPGDEEPTHECETP